jgi:hypothetical protein
MFHEVKIFDKKGKVKKVLSSKKLSTDYWDSFFKKPLSETIQKGKDHKQQSQNSIGSDDVNLE